MGSDCPKNIECRIFRLKHLYLRLLALIIVISILAAVSLAAVFIFNNNYDRWSDDYFQEKLDSSIIAAEEWIHRNSGSILKVPNAALIAMLYRCNELNANDDINKIAYAFINFPTRHYSRCWIAEVDPNYKTIPHEMNRLFNEQIIDYKWKLYALAPHQINTTAEELELFDSEKWQGRQLTHQLWSLILLNERKHTDTDISPLIEHLCERIRKELFWDNAVVDIYIQKVAFVICSGHPEKINRRWVQRIIENQNSDGGWDDRWMCFTSDRRPRFSKVPPSDEHATIQALYALYMVRYKYPQHFGIGLSQNEPTTVSSH